MKKVAVNITIISMIVYVLVLICFITLFADSSEEVNEVTVSPTNQYFEGSLSYTANGAFFEEAISGAVIPVDMASISRITESKLPQISQKRGTPVHISLLGYLTTTDNEGETREMRLTIQKIKKVFSTKCLIQPMTGTYKGGGQTLTIFANHTYTLQNKSGKENKGNWFLNSKNLMVLQSGKSKMIMRVNYKKKSLNSRDDHPTIFMPASNLSTH